MRAIRQDCPHFVLCLDEKLLAQNCAAPRGKGYCAAAARERLFSVLLAWTRLAGVSPPALVQNEISRKLLAHGCNAVFTVHTFVKARRTAQGILCVFPRRSTQNWRKCACENRQSAVPFTSQREIFARDKAEKEGILAGFPLLITQYRTKRSALRLLYPYVRAPNACFSLCEGAYRIVRRKAVSSPAITS